MIVPPFTCPEHNRQILLVERPVGIPQPEHFRLSETRRGLPQDGQILVRNLYLSVDPAQRGWAADVQNYSATVALNSVMRALGVGVVIESRISEVSGVGKGSVRPCSLGSSPYL